MCLVPEECADNMNSTTEVDQKNFVTTASYSTGVRGDSPILEHGESAAVFVGGNRTYPRATTVVNINEDIQGML